MQQRLDRFLALSSALTGFGRVQLLGTGVAVEYLDKLDAMLPAGSVDGLLAAYDGLPVGGDRDAAISAAILGDPQWGPLARNLIVLWYCGAWTVLPDAWHSAYGMSPLEVGGTVSAQAYLAGLQWTVAGAHPPGSRQQGFGAWATAPERTLL